MAKSTKLTLDAIDARILVELQRNGRLTITELAERVGLSPSPCLRRVKLLEERGAIAGYVAVVDQNVVGLEVNVFASIRLERQREEELERFSAAISQWPEVMECYLMTGTRDYLMRIVVGSLSDYERFIKDKLSRLEGVASIESSFALSRVKHTTVVPITPG
ncbi:MAG: AsnC family transcriptional regulator [Rhizobiales bacterium PAR1]|nr:MAG: AsnC family transcriptional regulator [Rhizobiales bacterium PAR1]